MGNLTTHQSLKVTKLLNCGRPGSGKTGALACLARSGYRIMIVDFDNGVDILVGLLRDDEEAMKRVFSETFTDKLQMVQDQIVSVGAPTAWNRAIAALTKWKFPTHPGSDETYDFGNVASWGERDILVIDSLGIGAECVKRLIRHINQHQFENFTSQPDIGQAMEKIENLLQLLFSDSIKCNIIVNTHIVNVTDPMTGQMRGEPRALGAKLPPKVGGYFNTVVKTETIGSGKTMRRMIHTTSDAGMELKVPIKPGTLPAQLPLEDGLLTIFKTLQSSEWIEATPTKEN